jgi:RIO kinase 1
LLPILHWSSPFSFHKRLYTNALGFFSARREGWFADDAKTSAARFLTIMASAGGLFQPLAAATMSALIEPVEPAGLSTSAHATADNVSAADVADVRDDASFMEPKGGMVQANYGEDDSDDDDAAIEADENMRDLDEWAAGGGGRANLTARLRPRNNANSQHAATATDRMDRAEDRRREHIARDKLDRATVEQVLDPRTRMILFRLLSRGRLVSLDGCVSTGKEANVYYATAPMCTAEGGDVVLAPNAPAASATASAAADSALVHVAVKVFKTSILSFKDRERYVAGEFRFRQGYNRSSNRKMVQQWCEKEYRNLLRLQEAGVPAPTALIVKPPVLVMTFFGRDGWPAPRLKDAPLSSERMTAAYSRVCTLMRRMYRRAKLVHGDLSEYNILYCKGKIIIIDVSQSVEDDHPMALDFLRRDCLNINEFFERAGAEQVLGLRELFDYVTVDFGGDETNIAADDKLCEERLATAIAIAEARDGDAARQNAEDDVVFNQSFIPRTLLDVDMRKDADNSTLDAAIMATLVSVEPASQSLGISADASTNVDNATDEYGNVNSESEEGDDRYYTSSDDDAPSKDDRKDNKKQVKAAKKEKRETKTPKHVKKRKEVLAKRRRHVKT